METATLEDTKAARRPRYDRYCASGIDWLGEIPAHWETLKLKYIFRTHNGATPKSTEPAYWNGDIAWVTPEDLGKLDGETVLETGRRITREGYQSCGATLVPPGSIVVSTRAPIGHLAIAGVRLCTNQGCRVLEFRAGDNRRYFYYLLMVAKQELQARGRGSTFMELSGNDLEDIGLILPPLPEQRPIAAYLDEETARIDGLMAKKERLIELLEEKRTALISRAVTRGLDPDVELKDSGVEWLGEIPVHWNTAKLKWSVDKIGSGVTPDGGGEAYVSNGITFLRSQNIHFDGLRLDDVVFIDKETDREMAGSRVLPWDVLLNITGASLGRCALVPCGFPNANVNQHVCIIRAQENKLHPAFLDHVLASTVGQYQIFAEQDGASREAITFAEIGDFVIPIPPVEEQRRIAEHVDRQTAKIDALIARVEDGIARLEEYRTALITAAVTGQIDVQHAFDG